MSTSGQALLFDEPEGDLHAPAWPDGLVLRPGFLSPGDEAELLALIATLPFEAATYKSYVARRRIVSYGGRFDFDALQLHRAPPMPAALHPLRDRLADWAGLPPSSFDHALVAEYAPGTPLGWHRDVPDFETIVGVSLAGAARMRLRPHAPDPTDRPPRPLDLVLPPRSVYRIDGDARWNWQHSIAPTAELRYSITFRTRRRG